MRLTDWRSVDMSIQNKLSKIAEAAERRDQRVMELLEKRDSGQLSLQDEQELNTYASQSEEMRFVIEQHQNKVKLPSWDSLMAQQHPGEKVPEPEPDRSVPSPASTWLDWLRKFWPPPAFGLAVACVLVVIGSRFWPPPDQIPPPGPAVATAAKLQWSMEIRGGDLAERSAESNGGAEQAQGVMTPTSIVTVVVRPQKPVDSTPTAFAYLTKDSRIVAALPQPKSPESPQSDRGSQAVRSRFIPEELNPPVGPGTYQVVILISTSQSAKLEQPDRTATGEAALPQDWQKMSQELTIAGGP